MSSSMRMISRRRASVAREPESAEWRLSDLRSFMVRAFVGMRHLRGGTYGADVSAVLRPRPRSGPPLERERGDCFVGETKGDIATGPWPPITHASTREIRHGCEGRALSIGRGRTDLRRRMALRLTLTRGISVVDPGDRPVRRPGAPPRNRSTARVGYKPALTVAGTRHSGIRGLNGSNRHAHGDAHHLTAGGYTTLPVARSIRIRLARHKELCGTRLETDLGASVQVIGRSDAALGHRDGQFERGARRFIEESANDLYKQLRPDGLAQEDASRHGRFLLMRGRHVYDGNARVVAAGLFSHRPPVTPTRQSYIGDQEVEGETLLQ